ncbi:MAG: hypothetical protein ACRCZJ_00040 [Erysipelotrichaceae bacterium]
MELFIGSYEQYYEVEGDTSELVEQATAWQEALVSQLQEFYPELTMFSSINAGEFKTLDDLNYGALLLCMVYSEANKPLPSKIKNMWMEDKLFLEASKANAKTAIPFLIDLPEILLPLDIKENFTYVDLENDPRNFASVYEIKRQLDLVAEKLFNNPSELEATSALGLAYAAWQVLEAACSNAINNHALIIIE